MFPSFFVSLIYSFLVFFSPCPHGVQYRLKTVSKLGQRICSVHKERMQQNFDVFDFTLSAEDMTAIEKLDSGESLFFSHYDPKTVEWFMSIL